MKNFAKIYVIAIFFIIFGFLGANIFLNTLRNGSGGKPYRVEANRIAIEIEKNGLKELDLSKYTYITKVTEYRKEDASFFESSRDCLFRQIGSTLYRFDYIYIPKAGQKNIVIMVNGLLILVSIFILTVLAYLHRKIIKPFHVLSNVPYELSKGNLTLPVKEQKSHYFGKFIWGIDMLRENIELQKQHELNLQREKKTLVLSISHDIKTPLSAIKLYSRALSMGLYADKDKQAQIAENINAKADEIESFVSQIIKASNEDFLNLEVTSGEFYLSGLVDKITSYYREKLQLNKINFFVGDYSNCLLKGDLDRGTEVVQNIIENAIKYGDGHKIELAFSEEDGCSLLCVKNSGCSLPETELPHIFESFWRGSNSGNCKGSGLGLYICRQLMLKMGGEIYAEIQNGYMCITVVFQKASGSDIY